jgi:hypothetical protein
MEKKNKKPNSPLEDPMFIQPPGGSISRAWFWGEGSKKYFDSINKNLTNMKNVNQKQQLNKKTRLFKKFKKMKNCKCKTILFILIFIITLALLSSCDKYVATNKTPTWEGSHFSDSAAYKIEEFNNYLSKYYISTEKSNTYILNNTIFIDYNGKFNIGDEINLIPTKYEKPNK